jgi:hypothetical protein
VDQETLEIDDLIPLIKQARSAGSLTDKLREASRDEYGDILENYGNLVDPLRNLFAVHTARALSEASNARELVHLDPADGPTNFHVTWSKMVDDGWDALPSYEKDAIAKSIGDSLVDFYAIQSDLNLSTEDTADALLIALNEGSMPFMPGHGGIFTNHNNGKILDFGMNAWAPQVVQKSADGTFGPIDPGPQGVIFHQKVTFPSGRLLIADAVRVDPIEIFGSSLRRELRIDVNYADHRVKYTGAFATFGVIDVMGSDSEPGIVMDTDTGCLFSAPSDDGFQAVADVCADYHGTTVIDRETLVQMSLEYLPTAGSREEVEASIDRWLASSEFANEVVVEPGDWHLYWDVGRNSVDEGLQQSGHRCPEDIGFVLSPVELDLSHAQVRSFNGTQSVIEEPEAPEAPSIAP